MKLQQDPEVLRLQLRKQTMQLLENPFSLSRFATVVLLVIPTSAYAQLTVLSSGNAEEKWQETQTSLLDHQLRDRAVRGELKTELEAQQKWLSTWSPGKLTTKPLWKPEKTFKILVEPVIDPNGTAKRLRQRLLGDKAKPTSRDTDALEKMLVDKSGDVGARQLHLHWLDQRQYRKMYSMEIADAAIRLAGLLDHIKPQNEATKTAKAFCLYRRGRALAYRELPEVVESTPIKDPKKHEAQLLGAYSQLTEMVGKGRPEFILLDIRMLRRDHWYGRALVLLETHGAQIDKQWFLKKRRDLLRKLNWDQPAKEASDIYAEEFPEAVAAE